MSEIWKPLDIGTYLDWCEAIINEASDELNSWETSFVENIYLQLNQGNNLTERQATKLEKIYAEKTK